jgi:hypothetical protein
LPRLSKAKAAARGIAARALEFTILTAARTGEVRAARWEEIDLAAKVWTVPCDRMKAGKEHRSPLAERAIAILEEMAAIREGDFVFPGGRAGRPLSDMALLITLRRMGQGELTVHGFRSSFSDWCPEQTNFPAEVRELALAHAVLDKGRGRLPGLGEILHCAPGRRCCRAAAAGALKMDPISGMRAILNAGSIPVTKDNVRRLWIGERPPIAGGLSTLASQYKLRRAAHQSTPPHKLANDCKRIEAVAAVLSKIISRDLGSGREIEMLICAFGADIAAIAPLLDRLHDAAEQARLLLARGAPIDSESHKANGGRQV